MPKVRPRPENLAAVYIPELGAHEVPIPAKRYVVDPEWTPDAGCPRDVEDCRCERLPRAAAWMFASDEDLDAEGGPVEQATAGPGERRNVRRPRG